MGKRKFVGKGKGLRKERLGVSKVNSLFHSFPEKGSEESDGTRAYKMQGWCVLSMDLFVPIVILRGHLFYFTDKRTKA